MFWLKAVNDITARQTRTSLHDVIKVCSIGYLTTQIELVLPICKSWSVHRIIKYFMSGLLFSLRNIYHSTTAYFLTHPVHTMVNLSAVAIRTVVANFRRTHSPSCWLGLRVGGQRRSVWIHEVNRVTLAVALIHDDSIINIVLVIIIITDVLITGLLAKNILPINSMHFFSLMFLLSVHLISGCLKLSVVYVCSECIVLGCNTEQTKTNWNALFDSTVHKYARFNKKIISHQTAYTCRSTHCNIHNR